METIASFPYEHQPVRSISLPTRTHPSSQRCEALLNHLKPCHERSISIQDDLIILAELYNCMEELFQFPQTQQVLLHYHSGKLVEQALSGSVTLLDACGAARDLLLVLREHVQTLQSALRRRRGDSSIESSISAYLSFRKKAKKEIAKQLGAMKRMENKASNFSIMGQDQNLVFLARVLKEASTIAISIFRSLLLFLSMKTKGSSLISKLKPMRLFSSAKEQRNSNTSDFEDINVVLYSILGRVRNGDVKVEVQAAERMLETLNAGIEGLEGGLDCTFRCLVQNRVCFLNMLAHYPI